MPRHRLSALAEADLEDIWEYIAQGSPESADRVTDAIVDRFPLLATQPYIGRARPELASMLRSLPVGNYVILYQPTDYGVEIARIAHGSRHLEALFE